MAPDLSQKLRRFYSASTAYRDHLAEKPEQHFANFTNLITGHIPPGALVLEIGAGAGQVARGLARAGYRVIATDISPLFLAVAAGQPSDTEAAFLASDAVALPFRDEAFDAVVAGELVEHLSDVPGVLDEMARVVRPGGRIILRSPALASPIWPLLDLPGLLQGRGGRPPHYATLGQAAAFFGANVARTVRIALARTPRFEARRPDLDLQVEGGDRDAAYWSSPIEISRYLAVRDFRIVQKVETAGASRFLARVAAFLSPTIALVAEKRIDPGQTA